MKLRFVIVGAGSLGAQSAHLLSRRGHEVVMIERDSGIASAFGETLDCGVIHGDGTRPAILSQADPANADALLTLTNNAQTNLIASLVGHSLGFSRIITRIDDEEFEHVALELGLTDTIVPTRTIGRHIVDVVEGRESLDLSGAIKGDASVFLFVAREQDAKRIEDLDLPEGVRVSHLYRDGDFVLADPDLALHEGDEVVIIGHRKCMHALRERWAVTPGDAQQ